MRIKTKYYYHESGKYFKPGGELIVKERKILNNRNEEITPPAKAFYYDDTEVVINLKLEKKRVKVNVNRIFTESDYGNQQREYLVNLNWLQQQKLLLMFNRHWIQQPGNAKHLILVTIILLFAGVGLRIITHSY